MKKKFPSQVSKTQSEVLKPLKNFYKTFNIRKEATIKVKVVISYSKNSANLLHRDFVKVVRSDLAPSVCEWVNE